MAGRDTDLEEETLFLALTRPVLYFGVPATPIMVNIGVAMIFGLNAGSSIFLAAGVFAVLHVTCRTIVRRDPNQFRVIAAFIQTSMRCLNRSYWGGASVTPLPVRRHYDERDFGLV